MSEAPKRPAKRRTPEEIQAQREAWLARKQAREAGLPVDEEPAAEVVAEETGPAKAEAVVTPAPAEEPVAAETAVVDEVAPAKAEAPASPSQRRSPEEIKAQREAMMAKREAKAAKATAEKEAPPPTPAKKAPAKKAAAPAKKKAAKKKANTFDRPQNVTRREFLNLAWLGSIALLTVQTLGVSVLFLFPRFKEGDFGGIIPIGNAAEKLPEVNAPPVPFASGKFWLTNTPSGAYAIYQVCTHLGCLYAWSDVTARFECPCHGSKYTLDGTFIEGPAPRSLDRFKIVATKPDGSEVTTPDSGGGLKLDGDETIAVDTGSRILLDGKVDASTLT